MVREDKEHDVSSASESKRDRRYAREVGRRLRAVRLERNLSRERVAALADGGLSAASLGTYERGSREIGVTRLRCLADIYGLPIGELLPKDTPAALSGPDGKMAFTTVRINLRAVARRSGPVADAIRQFVELVRAERRDFAANVLTLRGEDLRVLGGGLGLSEDQILRRVASLGLLAFDQP